MVSTRSSSSRSAATSARSIDDLADDLLLLIFNRFDTPDVHKAMRVCTRWLQLARSPGLFKELRFINFPLLATTPHWIAASCVLQAS